MIKYVCNNFQFPMKSTLLQASKTYLALFKLMSEKRKVGIIPTLSTSHYPTPQNRHCDIMPIPFPHLGGGGEGGR